MQSIECGVLSFVLFIAGWRYVRYKIKPHASLSRLMDEYIERRGMEGHSLRFFYNGKRITKRHTAAKVTFFFCPSTFSCFFKKYFPTNSIIVLEALFRK
ncbi:hypothetical protein NC652_037841 [Populus alba x Populus x berolinensis]|nr:hypothetical protein NC652_037841 [Populus alba x Populus x berolinensis]